MSEAEEQLRFSKMALMSKTRINIKNVKKHQIVNSEQKDREIKFDYYDDAPLQVCLHSLPAMKQKVEKTKSKSPEPTRQQFENLMIKEISQKHNSREANFAKNNSGEQKSKKLIQLSIFRLYYIKLD